MLDLINLQDYPLDRPGSPEWMSLVDRCKAKLAKDGLFNLTWFIKTDALPAAVAELKPILAAQSFAHARKHNIYFQNKI